MEISKARNRYYNVHTPARLINSPKPLCLSKFVQFYYLIIIMNTSCIFSFISKFSMFFSSYMRKHKLGVYIAARGSRSMQVTMDNIYLLKQFPIPELLLTAQDSVYKKNALWKQSVQNYGYYNITKSSIISATIHIHHTWTVDTFNDIQNDEEKHAWNQLPTCY